MKARVWEDITLHRALKSTIKTQTLPSEKKSIWWAEMRAVRKHRWKSNSAARPGERKPDRGRGDGNTDVC